MSIPMAEAAFRLIGDAPSDDLHGLYVPFDDGYKLGASVDTDAFWAAGRVSVHTDTLGLRTDRERRYATAPGDAIDVLVVGDSQGFGNGLNYEDSLAGSLAVIAARDGRSVRNASVGGHSLATQMSIARSLREDHRVSFSHLLVLLTPVMLANCDQENTAIVGSDGRLYGGPVTPEVRLRLWVKTHLVLYSRVRDAVRDSGIGVDPARTSPGVFEFYRVDKGDSGAAERKLYSCLQSVVAYSSAHDVIVHVAYLPSTIEADFEPLRRAAAHQDIVLDRDLPFRTYASVMTRLQLQPIDLRPTLEKVRDDGQMLNVKADFHYSAELSRALSASMWDKLDLSVAPAEPIHER